ncbi:CinA family protein [Spiribacter onubensis]|uniref:Nicotinamide-nucleotide amidohydrolase family protein n=1 Tax=Spiribacter onubensis TaxID=3122420 RepID=A0ABV3S8M7_9GAMM
MGADATDAALDRLASRVGEALLEKACVLVTAESCTGGWVAKTCTDLAGSSRWFDFGLVTYSNSAKQRLLGVPQATLAAAGAVSRETAVAMADGARDGVANRASVAITGVAGPGGGSTDKPVGLVWFAWGIPAREVSTECVVFEGDREAVRRHSVAHALGGLLRRLGADAGR